MGYIPPVRDEQSVLYGNRRDPTYRGIKPASPVVKGDFQRILSNKEKEKDKDKDKEKDKDKDKEKFNRGRNKVYKPNTLNNHNDPNKSKKSKVVRDTTGKGKYIDEVV